MSGRTKALSVHRLRRTARKRERAVTWAIDTFARLVAADPAVTWESPYGCPEWARGVRVEKAGLFSFVVTATEDRGH